MARYIDAEKLIDFKFSYITNERYKDGKWKSEEEIYAYKVGYNTAIEDAQFAQTVDVVERKRGNWETEIRTIRGHKIPFLACSICGIYAADEYTYCPHCGAEMKESTGSAGENKEKEIRT